MSSSAPLTASLVAGRDGPRRQRRLRPRRARVAERARDQAELPLHLDLHDRDLPARRDAADRVRDPLPPPQAAPRRGRCPGPRRQPARAGLDGRPGADPVRDRRVRLRQAPHDPGRPSLGCGVAEPRRRRDRHPVHVAVPLPERGRDDRPPPRAGGPDGRAPRHVARLGRHPLLVDPGARREDRCDPREAEQDVVQGNAGRRVSRASAPSSAASTTRRCSPRSR